jgi:uncharacterized protein involved in exopolysaccharide biosynthesis
LNGREPELIDYIEVLRRHRKLVLVGTLTSALATVVVILVWVIHYEASGNVEIGKVADEPLEDLYFAAAEINSPGFALPILAQVGLTDVRPERIPKYISAEVLEGGVLPNRKPIMLHIGTSSRSPQDAARLLDLVVAELSQRHQARFEVAFKLRKNYAAELEARVSTYEKDLKQLPSARSRLPSRSVETPTGANLVQADIGQRQTLLLDLLQELQEMQIRNNSEMHTRPTRLVDKPTLPDRLSPPVAILILEFLGGSVAGFLVFAFIAFLRDYLQRAKPKTTLRLEEAAEKVTAN